MQEVFEKIIDQLKAESIIVDDEAGNRAVEIIEQAAAEYNNGWIPVEEKLPKAETEVLIVAKRKFKSGECRYVITTAMYEDGTVLEYDSCWAWEEIEGEYDEENDCYIIPEGWWENRHYNPDGVYNNPVDDEVIAWQPLLPAYQHQPEGERQHKQPTNADRIRSMSDEELAHLIAEKIECTECPFNGSEEKCGNIGCSKLFLEWLQSEAEVES